MFASEYIESLVAALGEWGLLTLGQKRLFYQLSIDRGIVCYKDLDTSRVAWKGRLCLKMMLIDNIGFGSGHGIAPRPLDIRFTATPWRQLPLLLLCRFRQDQNLQDSPSVAGTLAAGEWAII